jgi:HEAT repeat protein
MQFLPKHIRRSRFFLVLAGALLAGCCILLALRKTPDQQTYRGRTISAWALQLNSNQPTANAEAKEVFKQLGSSAVPGVLRMLQARDSFIRRSLWAWGNKWPRNQQEVLARLVARPDAPVLRRAGAAAAGQIGPPAEPLVPALVRLANDADFTTRQAGIAAFQTLGTNGLIWLAAALKDSDPSMRQAAAATIGTQHPRHDLVEPALLELTRDLDPACRVQAIVTLAGAGIPGRAAVRAFISSLHDPEPSVRIAAARALGQSYLVAGPAVPELKVALNDQQPEVRDWAAKALAKIRAPATNGS